jgi:hypothetical protein
MWFYTIVFADYQSLDQASQSEKLLNMVWLSHGPKVENLCCQVGIFFVTEAKFLFLLIFNFHHCIHKETASKLQKTDYIL